MAQPTSLKATDLAVLEECERQLTKFTRGMNGHIDWLYDQVDEAFQRAGDAAGRGWRREHWTQAGRAEAYMAVIMELTDMTRDAVWIEWLNRR